MDSSPGKGAQRLITVVIALLANLFVALAKTAAAFLTGSASMAAEAAHSWADTGNEVFLIVADRRSRTRPTSEHPLGFGRESYVWSMFAAVGLFVSGSVLSVVHGVQELITSSEGQGFTIAYVVLAIAFLLEGTSFAQAFWRSRTEARRRRFNVLEHALSTSDSTLRAVLAEDGAALIGLLLAAAGVGLHQWTGSSAPDAIGSILIGVLLGFVAVILIDRNRRFLIGQAVSPSLRHAVLERLTGYQEVDHVTYLRMEYVGPDQVYVVASVDVIGDRAESDVAETLRRLETRLEELPEIIEVIMTISTRDAPAIGI